jgi:hypothetical protein
MRRANHSNAKCIGLGVRIAARAWQARQAWQTWQAWQARQAWQTWQAWQARQAWQAAGGNPLKNNTFHTIFSAPPLQLLAFAGGQWALGGVSVTPPVEKFNPPVEKFNPPVEKLNPPVEKLSLR